MEEGIDTPGNAADSAGRSGRNDMNCVVAYSPDGGGQAALAAARLFSSPGVVLTVCTIIPEMASSPHTAVGGAEDAESLWRSAAKGLGEAKAFLGDDVNAVYMTRTARSPAEGIIALVAEVDAGMVVLGASRDEPSHRFSVGSVTGDVLRGTQVPTVLAPIGYHPEHRVRLAQITYGYDEPRPSNAVAAAAAQLALRHERTQPVPVSALHRDRLGTMQWGAGDVLLIGSADLGSIRPARQNNMATTVGDTPVPTVVVPSRRAAMEQRVSAYHCPTCEVEGRDHDPDPVCWSCGGPTVVTSRPLLNTPGPSPDKSAVTPRNEHW
ncbi:universal stress protein [Pseudonocardia alaniniphila]|uniref:Universal stress protein n=1 Tax=Pseudonocardia alaniniphila TaxID=75291 RepID=A0ABS9TMM2_9PSEU|nr:universal stress protein [Pseudonocardia alaniniphila]MCH6169790.1 universal stress protein [Pseudonocardia alaniniphila]